MGEPDPSKGTIVYRISDGAKGIWPTGGEFPGGYSLVPPIFPVMKPTSDPVSLIKQVAKNPKNLILIGGIIAVVFFSKPLLKVVKKPLAVVKKAGRKVGIK